MAGKYFASGNPRSSHSPSSPSFLVAALSLLALASIFFFYAFSSYRCPASTPFDASVAREKSNPNPKSNAAAPEYSFVASLEKFLTSRRPVAAESSSAAADAGGAAVKALDDTIWEKETERLYGDPADPWSVLSVVRVYVYEMPAKFTYDLLWLFRNTYKETANLTSNGSPVHRLIEQHSIDYWLWADLITPESERLLKNVIRVHQQEEADLFYIPFFSTISFFLLDKQQCKALYRVWAHVPRYKPGQVWLEKDLILPYVPNVDFCDAKCFVENQSKRSTLLFFRGRLKRNAGGKIRSRLVEVLHDTEGVVIEQGSSGEAGKAAAQNGMRKSLFCLSPAGDTPSSARLFDAIVSGCIPVIVSDELELPFEGILDYRKIALFVSSSDAVQPGWLVNFLKSINPKRIRELQVNLAKYSRHFLYSSPAQPLGPEDLTWRMIAGKLVNIKLHTQRSQRLVQGSRSLCTCECRPDDDARSEDKLK
ncbi:probable arabinosyltransferase ARAD1 isoform X2 [Elaeis guineensis]|uniref:Probable arabinosyltransferase ARAD1 isoform X2 n=1 Tax=Elaeis guineensis var. tenera TaxID=51953 RepID=A0A6I9Q8N5_ELAGV|nr:probable arabinosyltransferase ARAD1 isoform X2 [Elaeis guineensis]